MKKNSAKIEMNGWICVKPYNQQGWKEILLRIFSKYNSPDDNLYSSVYLALEQGKNTCVSQNILEKNG